MAWTSTLAELIAAVKNRAGWHRSATLTDAVLTDFLNGAIAEVHQLLVQSWADYVTVEDTLSITASSATVALPSDFFKLARLDVLSGTQYERLRSFTVADEPMVEDATGDGYVYTLRAGNIVLRPTPSSSGTLRILYIPHARKLSVEHTVTAVDTGSANSLTVPGHNFVDGDLVELGTSAADPPAGLTEDGDYYVILNDDETVSLAATSGGSAIDITDAGTGTHTLTGPLTYDGVNGFEELVIALTMYRGFLREERSTTELEREIARLKDVIKDGASARDAAEPPLAMDHTAQEWWP